MSQEWIAYAIVLAAFLIAGYWFFRNVVADPLSRWLLKRGKVGQAMKIRSIGQKKNCH